MGGVAGVSLGRASKHLLHKLHYISKCIGRDVFVILNVVHFICVRLTEQIVLHCA